VNLLLVVSNTSDAPVARPAGRSTFIQAGNSALASFNAANGGVLNGTIQS
jgi:hypothetical protein